MLPTVIAEVVRKEAVIFNIYFQKINTKIQHVIEQKVYHYL